MFSKEFLESFLRILPNLPIPLFPLFRTEDVFPILLLNRSFLSFENEMYSEAFDI